MNLTSGAHGRPATDDSSDHSLLRGSLQGESKQPQTRHHMGGAPGQPPKFLVPVPSLAQLCVLLSPGGFSPVPVLEMLYMFSLCSAMVFRGMFSVFIIFEVFHFYFFHGAYFLPHFGNFYLNYNNWTLPDYIPLNVQFFKHQLLNPSKNNHKISIFPLPHPLPFDHYSVLIIVLCAQSLSHA